MKTKLQKEVSNKFLVWALDRIKNRREICLECLPISQTQLDELDELAEIELGLKVICTRAGMGNIFKGAKERG